MKLKRMVSVMAALAVSATTFAGMMVTANAATVLISSDNVTTDFADQVTINDGVLTVSTIKSDRTAVTAFLDVNGDDNPTSGVVTLSFKWELGEATGRNDTSYSSVYLTDSQGRTIFDYKFYGQNTRTDFNDAQVNSGLQRSGVVNVNAIIDLNNKTVTISGVGNHSVESVAFYDTGATDVDKLYVVNRGIGPWSNFTSVSEVDYEYEEAKEALESLSVKYITNDSTEVSSVDYSVEGLFSGNTINVPFNKYIFKDGILYEAVKNSTNPWYGESTQLKKNTVVERLVNQVDVDGEVIAFEEGSGATGDYSDIRCSGMESTRGMIDIGYVEPGIYKIETNSYSRGNDSWVYLDDEPVCQLNVHSDSFGVVNTEDIVIEKAGYMKVGYGKTSSDYIDYVLLIKTGDIVAPIPSAVSATHVQDYTDETAEDAATGASLWRALIEGTGTAYNAFDIAGTIKNAEGVVKTSNQQYDMGTTISTGDVYIYIAVNQAKAKLADGQTMELTVTPVSK